jgi:hypothetical protein
MPRAGLTTVYGVRPLRSTTGRWHVACRALAKHTLLEQSEACGEEALDGGVNILMLVRVKIVDIAKGLHA